MHKNFQWPPNQARLGRIQAKVEAAAEPVVENAQQRAKLGEKLINRLLNEQSHRPDAVRLLRQILRERAIRQAVKVWDENNLFG